MTADAGTDEGGMLHFPPGKCFLDGQLGIIRVSFEPMAEVTLKTAKAQVVAMSRLIGDRTIPALVDMRGVKSCDRDARDYYAGVELAALVSACGMLIGGNRVAAVIGNFTLAVHGGRLMPTKLFVKEAEAIEWLLTFLT
jgi:hypothetical protein